MPPTGPINPPPLPAWHVGQDDPWAVYLGEALVCLCVNTDLATAIVAKMPPVLG